MRRFVLVFIMLLLPLQWSWAAAASVCEHESGTGHFGHHEHQHGSGGDASQADDDGEPASDSLGNHPDCQACHGIGAACVGCADERPATWSGATPRPSYDRFLPDPPVENLLRPPLSLAA